MEAQTDRKTPQANYWVIRLFSTCHDLKTISMWSASLLKDTSVTSLSEFDTGKKGCLCSMVLK